MVCNRIYVTKHFLDQLVLLETFFTPKLSEFILKSLLVLQNFYAQLVLKFSTF